MLSKNPDNRTISVMSEGKDHLLDVTELDSVKHHTNSEFEGMELLSYPQGVCAEANVHQ